VNSLNGKLLRINPITGEGYSDNPFYDGDLASNRSKVYSFGLRNPFRVTINALTNEPFIGDVGWHSWEEINTGRGENFGWPCYEGGNGRHVRQGSFSGHAGTIAACAELYARGSGAVQSPRYAYTHDAANGSAVEAGAFYRGATYPSQYHGALFFSDYNADWIQYLKFDANGRVTRFDFAADVSPVGGIVQLLAGPDTNLYYVAYNGPIPNTSEVRRIRYTSGGNTPPIPNASAYPYARQAPVDVKFSSHGTFDPDAQPLTYLWDFGDGKTSTGANPTHTYLSLGTFSVTLTVTDSSGASGTDSLTITVGNLPPTVIVQVPADGSSYTMGDIVYFDGAGME